MMHLTHHIDNKPSIQELTDPKTYIKTDIRFLKEESTTEEFMSSSHQYFSFHKNTIIGFLEYPLGNSELIENKVELLIRDPVGKFSWSLQNLYSSLDELDPNYQLPSSFNAVEFKHSAKSSVLSKSQYLISNLVQPNHQPLVPKILIVSISCSKSIQN
jgi:hypothetical protein